MRLTTRLVMTLLMLGPTLPIQAQTTPVTVPAAVDTNTEGAAVSFPLTVPRAPLPDSTRHAATATAVRDLRVAAHYSASREIDSPTLVARQRAGLGQPMAMMVVGGTALLVGAIIGDTPGTIFMIGGAVIGLIGLYEYLQ
jgi:hypothetical protein